MYFRITEIDTDTGLFTSNIKKETYLKYSKELHYLHFIENEENISGKEIFTAEIRLEDDIYFHKRSYTKMSQVFSTIGGYMQVIYTSFTLVSLLTKKISIEQKLLNSLFNFNIKKKKIILCVEYKKKLDYVSSLNKRKNNYIQYQARKSLANVRGKGKKSSISLFNKNQNYELFKKAETGKKVISTIINENKSQNNISERGLIRIFNKMSVEKEKEIEHNSYANDQSINRSKLNLVESSSHLNEIQINKFISQRNNINKDIKLFENKSLSVIDFNLFDYYCLRNITKKKLK